MAGFKIPPISPLLGATFSTFRKVLKGNRVAPKYYFKMTTTIIVLGISSFFQVFDILFLRRRANKFMIKEPPLFIIGHWRSGTTFLHNILTKDPSTGFVTTYQAVFPNNLSSKWLFKTFMRTFMPSERPGDNMRISVNLPQEDEYALSNTTHLSYYQIFYFPTKYMSRYNDSIRFETLSENEKEAWKLNYRQIVSSALINTKGNRAVLKNPVNTGRMLTLIEIFPDAKFVFVVRNPIVVYLSSMKFFSQLFPTVNLESFSYEDISNMILDIYNKLMKDYLLDKKSAPQDNIIEIKHEVLQQNPISIIETIYSRFGYGGFKELLPVFQEYLDSQNGHKKDSYTIGKEELDKVAARFDFAMKHWDYKIPEDLNVIDKTSKL
jgi:hypothetical protein